MGATYMECSSKERIGVDDIFDTAIILATNEEDDVEQNDGSLGPLKKNKRKRGRKGCTIL